MRRLPAILLAALALPACGRGDGHATSEARAAPAPDRSTPEIVLAQAYDALAAGDWARLEPFLSAEGRARAEADLRAWHDVLTDPATGPRAAARVPVPDDEAGRDRARRALVDADAGSLLWLLARADPRPPLAPSPPATRPPGVTRVELAYPARASEWRRVVLSLGPDGWRIDRVQL
jgi:hypothetical protein